MRAVLVLAAAGWAFAWTSPVLAGPLAGMPPRPLATLDVQPAQYDARSSRAVRRCMRAKYGPNYYRGVKRAHRAVMAQSCGA